MEPWPMTSGPLYFLREAASYAEFGYDRGVPLLVSVWAI